jgi:hypothetical protein
VEVHVRDALADDVVQAEEGSFRSQRLPLGGGDAPAGVQERTENVGRDLPDGAPVGSRHDQGVPREDGSGIEESDDDRLVENHVGRRRPACYQVENTFRKGGHSRQRRATMLSMPDDPSVPLTTGPPETVLPPPPVEARAALEAALALPAAERRAATARVVGAHPAFLDGWARLSGLARDDVEAYAYARVGYHRGLDTLRGAGWRGSGYVRWAHETNRGFLRALDALRAAAASIGEDAEADRCALFLRQLDPDWGRSHQSPA